eukprot:TRINITY_DN1770_c0_g1_i2.p1 TRINITY_DN1770_c0_g1~~TRINITY_DN1770_c0_g1_i2.p1  ORF type:complete len:3550 (+),score=448.19 TRINITY_DN1770_c0_g1_i2:46-10695(+)
MGFASLLVFWSLLICAMGTWTLRTPCTFLVTETIEIRSGEAHPQVTQLSTYATVVPILSDKRSTVLRLSFDGLEISFRPNPGGEFESVPTSVELERALRDPVLFEQASDGSISTLQFGEFNVPEIRNIQRGVVFLFQRPMGNDVPDVFSRREETPFGETLFHYTIQPSADGFHSLGTKRGQLFPYGTETFGGEALQSLTDVVVNYVVDVRSNLVVSISTEKRLQMGHPSNRQADFDSGFLSGDEFYKAYASLHQDITVVARATAHQVSGPLVSLSDVAVLEARQLYNSRTRSAYLFDTSLSAPAGRSATAAEIERWIACPDGQDHHCFTKLMLALKSNDELPPILIKQLNGQSLSELSTAIVVAALPSVIPQRLALDAERALVKTIYSTSSHRVRFTAVLALSDFKFPSAITVDCLNRLSQEHQWMDDVKSAATVARGNIAWTLLQNGRQDEAGAIVTTLLNELDALPSSAWSELVEGGNGHAAQLEAFRQLLALVGALGNAGNVDRVARFDPFVFHTVAEYRVVGLEALRYLSDAEAHDRALHALAHDKSVLVRRQAARQLVMHRSEKIAEAFESALALGDDKFVLEHAKLYFGNNLDHCSQRCQALLHIQVLESQRSRKLLGFDFPIRLPDVNWGIDFGGSFLHAAASVNLENGIRFFFDIWESGFEIDIHDEVDFHVDHALGVPFYFYLYNELSALKAKVILYPDIPIFARGTAQPEGDPLAWSVGFGKQPGDAKTMVVSQRYQLFSLDAGEVVQFIEDSVTNFRFHEEFPNKIRLDHCGCGLYGSARGPDRSEMSETFDLCPSINGYRNRGSARALANDGIDLYIEPGERVVAPFSGIVTKLIYADLAHTVPLGVEFVGTDAFLFRTVLITNLDFPSDWKMQEINPLNPPAIDGFGELMAFLAEVASLSADTVNNAVDWATAVLHAPANLLQPVVSLMEVIESQLETMTTRLRSSLMGILHAETANPIRSLLARFFPKTFFAFLPSITVSSGEMTTIINDVRSVVGLLRRWHENALNADDQELPLARFLSDSQLLPPQARTLWNALSSGYAATSNDTKDALRQLFLAVVDDSWLDQLLQNDALRKTIIDNPDFVSFAETADGIFRELITTLGTVESTALDLSTVVRDVVSAMNSNFDLGFVKNSLRRIGSVATVCIDTYHTTFAEITGRTSTIQNMEGVLRALLSTTGDTAARVLVSAGAPFGIANITDSILEVAQLIADVARDVRMPCDYADVLSKTSGLVQKSATLPELFEASGEWLSSLCQRSATRGSLFIANQLHTSIHDFRVSYAASSTIRLRLLLVLDQTATILSHLKAYTSGGRAWTADLDAVLDTLDGVSELRPYVSELREAVVGLQSIVAVDVRTLATSVEAWVLQMRLVIGTDGALQNFLNTLDELVDSVQASLVAVSDGALTCDALATYARQAAHALSASTQRYDPVLWSTSQAASLQLPKTLQDAVESVRVAPVPYQLKQLVATTTSLCSWESLQICGRIYAAMMNTSSMSPLRSLAAGNHSASVVSVLAVTPAVPSLALLWSDVWLWHQRFTSLVQAEWPVPIPLALSDVFPHLPSLLSQQYSSAKALQAALLGPMHSDDFALLVNDFSNLVLQLNETSAFSEQFGGLLSSARSAFGSVSTALLDLSGVVARLADSPHESPLHVLHAVLGMWNAEPQVPLLAVAAQLHMQTATLITWLSAGGRDVLRELLQVQHLHYTDVRLAVESLLPADHLRSVFDPTVFGASLDDVLTNLIREVKRVSSADYTVPVRIRLSSGDFVGVAQDVATVHGGCVEQNYIHLSIMIRSGLASFFTYDPLFHVRFDDVFPSIQMRVKTEANIYRYFERGILRMIRPLWLALPFKGDIGKIWPFSISSPQQRKLLFASGDPNMSIDVSLEIPPMFKTFFVMEKRVWYIVVLKAHGFGSLETTFNLRIFPMSHKVEFNAAPRVKLNLEGSASISLEAASAGIKLSIALLDTSLQPSLVTSYGTSPIQVCSKLDLAISPVQASVTAFYQYVCGVRITTGSFFCNVDIVFCVDDYTLWKWAMPNINVPIINTCGADGDSTPPVPVGSEHVSARQTAPSALTVRFPAYKDDESQMRSYTVYVGSAPGTQDLVPPTNFALVSSGAVVLSAGHGQAVFATVCAVNNMALASCSTASPVLWAANGPRIQMLRVCGGNAYCRFSDNILVEWSLDDFADVPVVEIGVTTRSDRVNNVMPFTTMPHGTSSTVLSGLQLLNGETFWITMQATNALGQRMLGGVSSWTVVDVTAPNELKDGYVWSGLFDDLQYQRSRSFVITQWRLYDSQSPVAVRFALGTNRTDDVAPFRTVTGYHAITTGLHLYNGQKVIATVCARNSVDLETCLSSYGVTIDDTPPLASTVRDGADPSVSERFSNTTSLYWCNWDPFPDPESGILYYEVTIGRSPFGTSYLKPTRVSPLVHSFELTNARLRGGELVFCTITAVNGAGLETSQFSAGLLPDDTPPLLVSVFDGRTGREVNRQASNTTLCAYVRIVEMESVVTELWASVGTANLTDNVRSISPFPLSRVLCFHNMALVFGSTYHVCIVASNVVGLVSSPMCSPGVLIDSAAATSGVVRAGNEDEDLTCTYEPSAISAHWEGFDDPQGIYRYFWALGTDPCSFNVQNWTDVRLAKSALNTRLSLQQGAAYYASVTSYNGEGVPNVVCGSEPIFFIADKPVLENITVPTSQRTRHMVVAWSGRALDANDTISTRVTVGTQPFPFSNDVYDSVARPGSSFVLVSLGNDTSGYTVFVTVGVTGCSGLQSFAQSNGTALDFTAPETGELVAHVGSAGNGATTLDLYWRLFLDSDGGVVSYAVAVLDASDLSSFAAPNFTMVGLVTSWTWHSNQRLEDGTQLTAVVRATNLAGGLTDMSTELFIDSTAPARGYLHCNLWQRDTMSIAFSYGNFTDPHSLVAMSASLTLSNPSAALPTWSTSVDLSASAGTHTFLELSLVNGGSYLLCVSGRNQARLITTVCETVTVDTLPPTAVVHVLPYTGWLDYIRFQVLNVSDVAPLAFASYAVIEASNHASVQAPSVLDTVPDFVVGWRELAISDIADGARIDAQGLALSVTALYQVVLNLTDASGNSLLTASRPIRIDISGPVTLGSDFNHSVAATAATVNAGFVSQILGSTVMSSIETTFAVSCVPADCTTPNCVGVIFDRDSGIWRVEVAFGIASGISNASTSVSDTGNVTFTSELESLELLTNWTHVSVPVSISYGNPIPVDAVFDLSIRPALLSAGFAVSVAVDLDWNVTVYAARRSVSMKRWPDLDQTYALESTCPDSNSSWHCAVSHHDAVCTRNGDTSAVVLLAGDEIRIPIRSACIVTPNFDGRSALVRSALALTKFSELGSDVLVFARNTTHVLLQPQVLTKPVHSQGDEQFFGTSLQFDAKGSRLAVGWVSSGVLAVYRLAADIWRVADTVPVGVTCGIDIAWKDDVIAIACNDSVEVLEYRTSSWHYVSTLRADLCVMTGSISMRADIGSVDIAAACTNRAVIWRKLGDTIYHEARPTLFLLALRAVSILHGRTTLLLLLAMIRWKY